MIMLDIITIITCISSVTFICLFSRKIIFKIEEVVRDVSRFNK